MNHSARANAGFAVAAFVVLIGMDARSQDVPEGEILYYEEIQPGNGSLVVLDLKTGDKRPIGQSGSRPDHFPTWSADGDKIAFESYRKGGWHVWVCEADGSNGKRLSELPDYDTGSYEFDPAFAPDNETVIFVHADDLWTVTLQSPTPRRVPSASRRMSKSAPAYSPDGRSLLFVGTADWNVYSATSDGSELNQLTTDQGRNLAPQWSPDGKHILFYSDRNGSFELYEMTHAGENPGPIFGPAELEAAGFQITAFIDPWDNHWGATEQYRAGYSPDGRFIVFSRDIDGDRELFVSRRDGSDVIRITNRPGLDGQPAWRPKRP